MIKVTFCVDFILILFWRKKEVNQNKVTLLIYKWRTNFIYTTYSTNFSAIEIWFKVWHFWGLKSLFLKYKFEQRTNKSNFFGDFFLFTDVFQMLHRVQVLINLEYLLKKYELYLFYFQKFNKIKNYNKIIKIKIFSFFRLKYLKNKVNNF